MSYKYPSITLEFCMSTFEQYQPSTVNMAYDFEYGHNDEHVPLSNSGRLRFLRMARDSVSRKLEDEIERQAALRTDVRNQTAGNIGSASTS